MYLRVRSCNPPQPPSQTASPFVASSILSQKSRSSITSCPRSSLIEHTAGNFQTLYYINTSHTNLHNRIPSPSFSSFHKRRYASNSKSKSPNKGKYAQELAEVRKIVFNP